MLNNEQLRRWWDRLKRAEEVHRKGVREAIRKSIKPGIYTVEVYKQSDNSLVKKGEFAYNGGPG